MSSEEGEDRLLLDIRPTRDIDNQVAKLLPVTETEKRILYSFVIHYASISNLLA